MLDGLFNGVGLTAHGFCLSWDPALLSLHVASDLLIGLAYFALGDAELGRANIWHYHSVSGGKAARLISGAVPVTPGQIEATVTAFADIGADELIFNPTVGDLQEIDHLADLVL